MSDSQHATASDPMRTTAIWSVVLGLISIFGLFLPLQLIAAVAGLILGRRALPSEHHKLALAGIVLSITGMLVLVLLAVLWWWVIQNVGLERALEGFFDG